MRSSLRLVEGSIKGLWLQLRAPGFHRVSRGAFVMEPENQSSSLLVHVEEAERNFCLYFRHTSPFLKNKECNWSRSKAQPTAMRYGNVSDSLTAHKINSK